VGAPEALQILPRSARGSQSRQYPAPAVTAIWEPCAMNDEVAAPAELDPKGAAPSRAEAAIARRRELERFRRVDAARITALVQYMLHRGDEGRDLAHH
jgi:hypothetical protein